MSECVKYQLVILIKISEILAVNGLNKADNLEVIDIVRTQNFPKNYHFLANASFLENFAYVLNE